MNALVVEARAKLGDLIRAEYRGPGDMERTLERLARRLGLASSGPLWALRYRPPKGVDAALYLALAGLHGRLRDASLKVHADERDREAPRTVVGRSLAGLAAAVDRANFGPLEDGAGR